MGSSDPLTSILVMFALPVIAIILLASLILLAMRGGRPFRFNASGFGVSLNFVTTEEDSKSLKDDNNGPQADDESRTP